MSKVERHSCTHLSNPKLTNLIRPYLLPPFTLACCAADSKAVPEGPSDQLLLWAVEGLAGVVINGIPNNVPGTRALNTPKAVLWGQHQGTLTWPGMALQNL